jgi:peptidoglycan/xylan/chitin deacetylase (PgdA/CDA1 family)
MKYLRYFAVLALCLGFGAAGCRKSSGPAANLPNGKAGVRTPAKPMAAASDAELARAKVNEAGQVPILEYHNIRVGKTQWDRSPEVFRKDLDTLYREGYRPISLHELLDNRIDVPLGMTPVVFTFDDSSSTQFHYMPDGSLDPDCAFAILKSFHEAHPDFAMKAIFFMNASPTGQPAPVFGQPDSAERKVKELLAAGMEIGNHTVTHRNLKKLSDAEVQKELAECVVGVHKLAPEAVVDTMALPFGVSPRNKRLAESGEADGVTYHNRAILLVGANPAPAPCGVKFNPLKLPRVQAYDGVMGSEYWFQKWRKNPKSRYISDGDPATVTVPESAKAKIDPGKLGAAKLRTY